MIHFSRTKSWVAYAAILLALGISGISSLRAAQAGDDGVSLPRYKFQVGQQLNFQSTLESKYQGGSCTDTNRSQTTIVGKNDDGTYRAVLRLADSIKMEYEGMPKGVAGIPQETLSYAIFDVSPAGRVTERFDSFGDRLSPQATLPKLPENAAELAGGWQAPGAFDAVYRYRALPQEAGKPLQIEVANVSPLDEIYGSENRTVFIFDTDRGLLDSLKSISKQSSGFKGGGAGEGKFVDVQMKDADWCAKFAADAERFFKAKQQFSKVIEDQDRTDEATNGAVAALKEAKHGIETPEFQQQLDKLIEDFERYKENENAERIQRKALIGQQADDFKTTDLDDKPQALADFRGKVVLLDFWYRGCGWCIRAMPQLKQVAEHYRHKPVALLGMNTDHDVADAKFVVEKLGLAYPNLKAEGLPEKFNVHGFPTLVIIDQEGKISDFHVGYSASLKDILIKKIDRLLADKQ